MKQLVRHTIRQYHMLPDGARVLCGLSGGADSKQKRKALQKKLGLPDLLSASSLLEVLNTMMTRDELYKKLEMLV